MPPPGRSTPSQSNAAVAKAASEKRRILVDRVLKRVYAHHGISRCRLDWQSVEDANAEDRLQKAFHLKSETRKVELSAELFNVFNIDNVIFGGTTSIYGLGVSASGATVPADSRFLVLKTADGKYNTQNSQLGFPFQAQFGIRFFF